MTEGEAKILEARLRRILRRRWDYRLQKSRRRDEHAPDFEGYMIIDNQTGSVIQGNMPFHFSMSLDDVDGFVADKEANNRDNLS